MFKEHDTPPPFIFMEGSCIIEVPHFDPATQPLNTIFVPHQGGVVITTVGEPFLAHVKVVDGSGEMLFRFDNNADPAHDLSMRLNLTRFEAGHRVSVGEFILISADGELRASFPQGYKIDFRLGDPAMSNSRFRLRLLEEGSNEDVDISQVHIYKDTDQGSIPLYSVVFSDLKSEGKELKVMLWTEMPEPAANG